MISSPRPCDGWFSGDFVCTYLTPPPAPDPVTVVLVLCAFALVLFVTWDREQ